MTLRDDAKADDGTRSGPGTAAEVLLVFLRLGLTSFGGPIAHLGYFRAAFVERRRWLDDRAYADLVALCQFLPGPASSQVGIAVGLLRAGFPGALAAWIGFTMPSAIALVAFAYGIRALGDPSGAGWLHGLKIAAVAVVAQAVLGMLRSLAPDRERATLAVIAATIVLAVPSAFSQIVAIVIGGLAGLLLLPRGDAASDHAPLPLTIGRTTGVIALILFFVLLAGLPVLASTTGAHLAALVEAFYRAGSLVFGGGHVVLPLLQAAVVPPGWMSNDAFLAGYGAAQAVPGPLFTFAAYLGAVAGPAPNGWLGGAIALAAIFLPSFLLVIGVLPFWEALRRRASAQATLRGVNAAVVGILLAALYDPVWTAAIHGGLDVALAAAAFLLLVAWKTPPWLVVLLSAGAGALLALV
ncbi:chromate transporter [Rhodoplanes elegans]|uniref:Chromate transporter n=1 Tax=Rhodoplanes elegans TaxID=29408 RepID=A0A327KJ95_9BRAD|nr:chromate transporter [Rhodoplanes elegans]RAI38196.1 chromate transporter [Rhodoplanes elegans]